MPSVYKKFSIGCLSILFAVFFVTPAEAMPETHASPKLANYYLSWELSESEARTLAEWDLVVLDMEIQYRAPGLLQKMRQWNPDITILVYITPQEIRKDAAMSYSRMRRRLALGMSDEWYLKNSSGNKLSWWPGTYLLNVTNKAFQAHVVDFVTDELLDTGYWDGVFYDNSWDNITHFAGTNIDLSGNGRIDTNLDARWRVGMSDIYRRTRNTASADTILLGNNNNTRYLEELNGKLLENADQSNWVSFMNTARMLSRSHKDPRVSILNTNTGNTGVQRFQDVRFGISSALLEDMYFSYDYGDRDHGQLWRYDEYDVHLGDANGSATSKSGNTVYTSDVWQRDFEHGRAVVNSTNNSMHVDLGGEFEHIRGVQDAAINDGSIVSDITLAGGDGRILLKTFDTLDDMIFINGDFARFFRPDGTRVRNGFFLFDEAREGGEQVAHIDMNGDGKRELFVVDGNKIMAWQHDGQPFFNPLFPYTANYEGELRVLVADINNDRKVEIYVAPSSGYPAPIKVYTRYGFPFRHDWFPFGAEYSGGYSLALASLRPASTKHIVLGAGTGVEPRVGIYTWQYSLVNQWLAYESTFRGGVNVAAGDTDGDNIDEVIVGAGPGKPPVIRVFEIDGTQIDDEFTAYSSFGTPGIDVRALDVDFDGKDDIVGLSNGI